MDQEDVKILSLGPSGTVVRDRAVLSWYQIIGHKEPVYKAYVHQDRKDSNPIQIYLP